MSLNIEWSKNNLTTFSLTPKTVIFIAVFVVNENVVGL